MEADLQDGRDRAVSRPDAATSRALCRLEEIEDGEAKGFTIDGDGEPLEIFVVRQGGRVYGYVNSCPHVGTPLDWAPDRFMSEDGGYIQCSTHGALFQIEDGECIAGPCAGDSLRPAGITLDAAGFVVLDET